MYKDLAKIETAFRNLKTTELEIRPVYHRTDDRVRAHVFLCMLSYYLLWHFQKAIKPLMDNNPKYTADYFLKIMESQQKLTLTIGDIVSETISEPSEMQNRIIALCNAL